MQLTAELRAEYDMLFASCAMQAARRDEAFAIANRMLKYRTRYQNVTTATGVPWFAVGALHNMESGGDWTTHLHNGDPLTHRTTHEPAGRPPMGTPPFAWEFSAADALAYDGLTLWHDWSLAGCLFKCEGYNGWGYRAHHVHSPYLWGGTNHQQPGKFVADGVWSATAQSQQIGVAAILHVMEYEKMIAFK